MGVGGTQAECVSQPQRSCSPTASRGGQWGAWMPSSISAFEGTCVSIPCRFSFPDELRPAVVHGVWYFNSPYPKNYPPVVFKSRTQVVHESFQGRSRLLGDLGLHWRRKWQPTPVLFFLHSHRKPHQRLTCAQVCVGEASPGAGVYVAVSRARVVLLKTEEPRCLHHSITRAWQHLSRVRQVFKRCLVKN